MIRAAIIVMAALRLPRLYRSWSVAVVQDRQGALERLLEIGATFGVVGVPLVWLDSPLLSFADYSARRTPFLAGVACLVLALWSLHRSHLDLGMNWSMTLQVRKGHRLVTHGVYRDVRHPMYAAFFLYAIGQLLVLPNWVAGPSPLIAFGILFAFRVRAEESMMLDEFGADYSAYMARTKRLLGRDFMRRAVVAIGIAMALSLLLPR